MVLVSVCSSLRASSPVLGGPQLRMVSQPGSRKRGRQAIPAQGLPPTRAPAPRTPGGGSGRARGGASLAPPLPAPPAAESELRGRRGGDLRAGSAELRRAAPRAADPGVSAPAGGCRAPSSAYHPRFPLPWEAGGVVAPQPSWVSRGSSIVRPAAVSRCWGPQRRKRRKKAKEEKEEENGGVNSL